MILSDFITDVTMYGHSLDWLKAAPRGAVKDGVRGSPQLFWTSLLSTYTEL